MDHTNRQALSFQSHLERISDFLLPGQGVWWLKTTSGIEFYDGPNKEEDYKTPGPELHFRNTMMGDLQAQLLKTWEECINESTQLPLPTVRQYGPEGNLENMLFQLSDDAEQSEDSQQSGYDLASENELLLERTNTVSEDTGVQHANTTMDSTEITAMYTTEPTDQSTPSKSTMEPYKAKTKVCRLLMDFVPDRRLIIKYDQCQTRLKQLMDSSARINPAIIDQYSNGPLERLNILKIGLGGEI